MLKIRPLQADLQKLAVEELNEVPERLNEDIQALRNWIEQQPHLNARTDDQFLAAFLRGCKHSMEKAKTKIDKFYTLRTKYPDFFTIQNVYDERVLKLIRLGIGLPLPTPLFENGPRIHLLRPGCYHANEFSLDDVMALGNALQILTLLEDDYAVINGYVHIVDISHLSAAHILQMTPSAVKKVSAFSEEAVPLRQKGTHFINTSSAFETVFNVVKPLLPQDKQNRIFVHGNNITGLFDHVPQKYLPKEYGGENGCIEDMIAAVEGKFLEYRDFLKDDLKYGTIEKFRPGGLPDYDCIFGVDGSFRKLNVD